MTVLENVMTSAQNQRGESLFSALMTPRQVAAQERTTSTTSGTISYWQVIW